MLVKLFPDKLTLAHAVAAQAATAIQRAISDRGRARIIAATGTSQLEFLHALTQTPSIEWQKVEMFHLDEYIGLPATHPASFRKFLTDYLIRPTGMPHVHFLGGDASDLSPVMCEAGAQLASAPVDIAFLGIGENGHIAFNDPPADFKTEEPYIIVNLDEACRRQQVGEGWFDDISQVPRQAISMSPRQILKADELVVIAPDQRKAAAVQRALEGEITPDAPASILRLHPNATLHLDTASASKLRPELRRALSERPQEVTE